MLFFEQLKLQLGETWPTWTAGKIFEDDDVGKYKSPYCSFVQLVTFYGFDPMGFITIKQTIILVTE